MSFPGVSPYDPATIATAIIGLLCVAALSAWLIRL
jgi:hypothetical protein